MSALATVACSIFSSMIRYKISKLFLRTKSIFGGLPSLKNIFHEYLTDRLAHLLKLKVRTINGYMH